MNMVLRQCFARVKPFRPKKSYENQDFVWLFQFSKTSKCIKKARISKSGFNNTKLATMLKRSTQQINNPLFFLSASGWSGADRWMCFFEVAVFKVFCDFLRELS